MKKIKETELGKAFLPDELEWQIIKKYFGWLLLLGMIIVGFYWAFQDLFNL